MPTQHDYFMERLEGSSWSVLLLTEIMRRRGYTVELLPKRVAPTAAEHAQYADVGDMFVYQPRRVEVKHLDGLREDGSGYDFTGADDWKQKVGPHVLVSNVDSVDRANGEVRAWYIFNRKLTHMAIVKAETRPNWYTADVRCRNTGNIERNYCCPLHLVVFEKVSLGVADG